MLFLYQFVWGVLVFCVIGTTLKAMLVTEKAFIFLFMKTLM